MAKKDFVTLLNSTSLGKEDKEAILFLLDFLDNKHIKDLSSKSFIFSGSPGVGKTHLIEKLLETTKMPILFLGSYSLPGKDVKKVKTLKAMLAALERNGDCIVFIDDFENAVKLDDIGEISDSEKKAFMAILEQIKRCKEKKVLLITLNNIHFVSEVHFDRVEVKIEFDLPSEKNKEEFLEKMYGKYVNRKLISFLARNSVGYNFRDLPEVIKLAYREGRCKINKGSLKKALSTYKPSSLQRFKVLNGLKVNFKDVIGNEEIKQKLRFLKTYLKKKDLLKKRGVKGANLLIFSGPSGTGKTYMAKALAGELGLPLINISPERVFSGEVLTSLHEIASISRRFRNCIIFLDEADKVIGRGISEEDGPMLAKIESELDGINANAEAIIILAMNTAERFGDAIHDRFTTLQFSQPNLEERRAFLEKKARESGINLKTSLDHVAGITEGKSYRDLEKIWNNIVFKVVGEGRGAKSKEDLTKIVEDTIAIIGMQNSGRRDHLRMIG